MTIVDFAYGRRQAGLSVGFRHSVAEQEAKNYAEESLKTQLTLFSDRMHQYIAANHFYYDAVESLFSGSSLADGTNQYSHYGLTLITHWLCEQDKALLESLTEITSKVAVTTDEK